MKTLKEQRRVFRWWFKNVLKGDISLLKEKASNGKFEDESVDMMFICFCAGWDAILSKGEMVKKAQDSEEFKKNIMH